MTWWCAALVWSMAGRADSPAGRTRHQDATSAVAPSNAPDNPGQQASVQQASTAVRRGFVHFKPAAAATDVPAPFRLPPHQFAYEMTPRRRDGKTVRCWNVTFPSPVHTPWPNNNRVHCEYYPPRVAGTRPGVVVLHILGGDFELSRVCCRALAISGSGALFVKLPYYGPRRQPGVPRRMISADPDATVAGMRQGVLDVRRAVAWLAARPEIDARQLGITGISLGGIVSALAAEAEPRLTKACLVLAGGDITRAAWQSPHMEASRRYWRQRGITRAKLERRMRSVDPVTYAARLRGRQILMINALHDEIIPRACSDALWRALGQPEIIWWNSGHISAIWHLPEGIARICAFFKERRNNKCRRYARQSVDECQEPRSGDRSYQNDESQEPRSGDRSYQNGADSKTSDGPKPAAEQQQPAAAD